MKCYEVNFKKVNDELGSKWKTELDSFDTKPFAAASIGQVHEGVLKKGKKVAIKIQVNLVKTVCSTNL